MTVSEFNNEYKDYIEHLHYGLDINDKKVIKFLDNIFQDLINIPNFKFSQIKLKFGTCRFYSNLSNELNRLIENKINKLLL